MILCYLWITFWLLTSYFRVTSFLSQMLSGYLIYVIWISDLWTVSPLPCILSLKGFEIIPGPIIIIIFFLHNNKFVSSPWYRGYSVLLLGVSSVFTEQVAGAHQSFSMSLLGMVSSFPMWGLTDSLGEPLLFRALSHAAVLRTSAVAVYLGTWETAMKVLCPLQNPADAWRQATAQLSAEFQNLDVCSEEHRAPKGGAAMFSSWFHWAWLRFHESTSKVTSLCV